MHFYQTRSFSSEQVVTNNTNKTVLKSLDMLTAAQKQKSREILSIIEDSVAVDFNDTGEITVNKNSTKIPPQHFSTTYNNQTKT